jgi:ubiquinone/menaquinone biosynthesis C-methylase UbiE
LQDSPLAQRARRPRGEDLRRQADVTRLPFSDAAFDIVFSQHVQMNVADKARLYAEARRVLAAAGRLAIWGITAGAPASPATRCPGPTSRTAATSPHPPGCEP